MTIPPEHRHVTRTHWMIRILLWPIAAVDSRKQGLSMTRLAGAGILWGTFHLSHDWIEKATKDGVPLGWAFASFVLGLCTLAVCTILGGKYVSAFLNSKFAESGK